MQFPLSSSECAGFFLDYVFVFHEQIVMQIVCNVSGVTMSTEASRAYYGRGILKGRSRGIFDGSFKKVYC